MIPFGPLDGAKVKDWSEPIWFQFFFLFVILIYLWMSGNFSPIDHAALKIAGLF